jgi:hypothetical protein
VAFVRRFVSHLKDELVEVLDLLGVDACRPLREGEAPPSDPYRGTSLIRNSAPLGPYSKAVPRALWWS